MPERAAVGQSYPRALRDAEWQWWKALVAPAAVLVFVGAVLGLLLVWAGVATGVGSLLRLELPADLRSSGDAFDATPVGFAVNNLLLAVGIGIAVVGTAVTAGSRATPGVGRITSVTGRLRWRLLLLGAVAAAIGMVLIGFAPEWLGLVDGGSAGGHRTHDWVWLMVAMVLTTPLQAAGEEYFFRGWLSQWIGAWFATRWVAVMLPLVVSATLFAFAHGSQNVWLFSDRLAFGLVASLLAWRSGGLELGIAFHTVNNLVAIGTSILAGTLAQSMAAERAGWVDATWGIGRTVVIGAILLGVARVLRAERTIAAPAPAPAPATATT